MVMNNHWVQIGKTLRYLKKIVCILSIFYLVGRIDKITSTSVSRKSLPKILRRSLAIVEYTDGEITNLNIY